MPNLITHIWFAGEVANCLPKEIADVCLKHKDAFILGNLGPDFMYALREMGFSTRSYPNELHHNRQHKTFEAIAEYLRNNDNPEAYAYALGMICHYAADKNIHPFVNAFCEGKVTTALEVEAMASAHGLIESAIDTYIVTERMGISNPNDYRPDKAMKSKKKTRRQIGKMFVSAIDELHGYTLTEAKASLSFEVTRLFLKVANDPHGIRKPIFRALEKLVMGGSMKVTALMRPPVHYGEIDYLNFDRTPYRAIRNKEGDITLNALEVLDVAKREALEYYVPALYSAVENGTPLDATMFAVNYEGVEAGN